MISVLLSGPASEPVTIAQMREHLRLHNDDDSLLGSLVAAARMTIEAQSGLRLIHQSWRILLDNWPQQPLRLPVTPVDAIQTISLVGVQSSINQTLYWLDGTGVESRLSVMASRLPLPKQNRYGIQVDVRVGFGASADDVPEDLRLAVLKLAAHWYDIDDWNQCRGDGAVPPQVNALISNHRGHRL